jgi:hypothetical protein
VLRTYYGPDADPFSALVLANRQRMWFEALRTDIQVRRAKGASIQEVLRVEKDYLASSMKNLESMIECQARLICFLNLQSPPDPLHLHRCSGARL